MTFRSKLAEAEPIIRGWLAETPGRIYGISHDNQDENVPTIRMREHLMPVKLLDGVVAWGG